jgi:hypothetical protein
LGSFAHVWHAPRPQAQPPARRPGLGSIARLLAPGRARASDPVRSLRRPGLGSIARVSACQPADRTAARPPPRPSTGGRIGFDRALSAPFGPTPTCQRARRRAPAPFARPLIRHNKDTTSRHASQAAAGRPVLLASGLKNGLSPDRNPTPLAGGDAARVASGRPRGRRPGNSTRPEPRAT